jgi:hypothetical protein
MRVLSDLGSTCCVGEKALTKATKITAIIFIMAAFSLHLFICCGVVYDSIPEWAQSGGQVNLSGGCESNGDSLSTNEVLLLRLQCLALSHSVACRV